MPTRRSAAWVLVIVIVLSFIMGTIILTAVDPVVQALFDSNLWQASTVEGKDALSWMSIAWMVFPTMILVALITQIWVDTRQPT